MSLDIGTGEPGPGWSTEDPGPGTWAPAAASDHGPWLRQIRAVAGVAAAGLVVGGLTAAVAAAYLGPDRVLADGQLVSRDLGHPVNDLPAGTPVTVTPSLPTWATWAVPVLLDSYAAAIGQPWLDANGAILGYVVTCTDPNCAGRQTPVRLEQIVGTAGDGRSLTAAVEALIPG